MRIMFLEKIQTFDKTIKIEFQINMIDSKVI